MQRTSGNGRRGKSNARRGTGSTDSHASNGSAHGNPSVNRRQPSQPLPRLSNGELTNLACRFVLKPNLPFTPQSIDIEKQLPSSLVWRVFSPVRECPICLEAAEVPRMLTCGHLMCLNCMIQHRIRSETPNQCAICGESVSHSLQNTLSVTFLDSDPSFLPKEGEEVVLTLMKREKQSIVALPVNLDAEKWLTGRKFPTPEFILWTRLCQEGPEYATRELANDLHVLIEARNKSIKEFGSDEGYSDAINDLKALIQAIKGKSKGEERGSKAREQTTCTSANPVGSLPSNSSAKGEFSYFYQVAFESTTFYTLSPLDVSILRAAFGSYENFPSSLIVKVENIETGIIDHTNDKRLNFLNHVPEQTPVAYLECDWKGIVADEVLNGFKTKLQQRHKHKISKTAKDILENEKAKEAIDNQFKIEVAEALTPHDIGPSSSRSIDTNSLPSLGKSSQPKQRVWVDPKKEYEKVMANSYVEGKKIHLRF